MGAKNNILKSMKNHMYHWKQCDFGNNIKRTTSVYTPQLLYQSHLQYVLVLFKHTYFIKQRVTQKFQPPPPLKFYLMRYFNVVSTNVFILYRLTFLVSRYDISAPVVQGAPQKVLNNLGDSPTASFVIKRQTSIFCFNEN